MNLNRFPPLFFEKYRFSVEVTSPMLLPEYKGSTFRGGVLTAFKSAVCMMPHGQCEICPLTDHCSYYSLFESIKVTSSLGVPMPYIIEPPLTERRMFDAGDALEFSVALIGKATVYWKLLIFAVRRLGQTCGIGRRVDGRRGRFRLKRVDSVGLNDSTVTVYSAQDDFQHDLPIMLTEEEVSQWNGGKHGNKETKGGGNQTQYSIRFLTPVCLIENVRENSSTVHKRLVTELDFPLLMRALIRRLGGLSAAYCDGGRFPLSHLLDLASEIHTAEFSLVREDIQRYSRRQQKRHPIDGMKGTLRLEGNLEPFLPYLRLGEWLHIGKKTTFGLGQYQIESEGANEEGRV